MCRLAPDMQEARNQKNNTPDGQLGFPMPQMAKDVIAQLWVTGRSKASLPGYDLRYAHKKR